MNTYAALLRGINVGGKRKIKMLDLRKMFENLGFEKVQTYIQSGNIVFSSTQSDVKEISRTIKNTIFDQFSFDVPVIIRTFDEYKLAVENNPFLKPATPSDYLILTFLDCNPDEDSVKSLDSIDKGNDLYKIRGKEIYIYCEGKYHQSKLTNNLFEKKLGMSATTRNWNTTMKIWEMMNEVNS